MKFYPLKDKNKDLQNEFEDSQSKVLESIKISRIILPIFLGLIVVLYLVGKSFDIDEFRNINWNNHILIWISIAIFFLVLRHCSYAYRIYILSDKQFSWWKSVELIFIWEFSSAVSPTSIGGSAVAFFVLAQEKLSTARTATIVTYTIVLDTLFFVTTLPILLLILGTSIIRPNMESFQDIDALGYTFIFAYFAMATYGFLFYWGLFQQPKKIKDLLLWITKIKPLRRFKAQATSLGEDIMIASQEMKSKDWIFHLKAFGSTIMAWIFRFTILSSLIIAFTSIPLDFLTQFALFARLETMFVIIAFSPTPGGAGIIEALFGAFVKDYVEAGTQALVISLIWRLLTYYSYLIIGAFVIPNWIRKIINVRKKNRLKKEKAK